MLRTSIVAKKELLALKQSPETIVKDCQTRCKALPEKILDENPYTLLDQMFAIVVIVTAYNSWLSSQLVNPSLHIKVERGDIGDTQNMRLTLLYDFRQMGFQIDSETRVVGVYEDVVDMCVFHLRWLHRKRLCPQNPIISSVVPYFLSNCENVDDCISRTNDEEGDLVDSVDLARITTG